MSTDPLQRALVAFVDPIRIRVYREDTHHGEWQTLPSLFDQLTSSGQWAGGNNGGGAYGSRPVISTGAVSIIIAITDAITEAANDFGRIITRTKTTRTQGCWCKDYNPCRGYKDTTTTSRDYTAELRAIAANIPDADLKVWWTAHLLKWAGQTKAALGLNPNRPTSARGVACPDCQATHATQRDDERTIRTPALAITWGTPDGEDSDYHQDHDYKVRAVECRACGAAWWRGPDLDGLVEAMFNQRNKAGAA